MGTMMKRSAAMVIRAVLLAWIPSTILFAFTAAFGQGAATSMESPGVHLSVEVLGVIAGIVAVIAPAFWFLGRYDHRISANESAIVHLESRVESAVLKNIAVGERIATAIEALQTDGLSVSCPLENCPKENR
jgi:hypothetical protein